MTRTIDLLYLAAVTLLILTPGPTMLMRMANALNHGVQDAMGSAAGTVDALARLSNG